MEEPLVIPITSETEGVDAGIDAVSKAFGELNQQLDATNAKGAKAGKATADAAKAAAPAVQELTSRYQRLAGWIEKTWKGQNTIGRGGGALAGSMNNLMEQLAGEARELAHGTDDATQSFVNMAASALPSMGPVGAALAGLAGGIGLINRAEREQQEAMRVTNDMLDERIRLGRLAANVEATAPRGATDAQRLQLLQAEGARIRAAVIAEENRIRGAVANMDTDAAHAATIRLRDAVNGALPGIRSYGDGVNRNTQLVEVLSAVTSQNEAQLRAWGLSVQFGANAATNNAAAIQALAEQRERTAMVARQSAQREVELARAQVDSARRMAGGRAAIEASTTAAARLQRANTELAAAEREVAAATGAATRAAREHAVAVDSEIAANNRLKDAERERQKHAATARAEANQSSLLERIAATRAMSEAEYELSRAQVLSAAGGHHDRLRLENVLRVEGIRHLRDQIVLAEEDSRRGRQRNENATQALARRAQAVERVATLTRELAAAEDDEAQRAVAAREALTAQMQAAIDTADRLAATRAAAGLAAITRETEELTRASARYTAEHAGEYQSRAERVAQIDRETAARAVLVARLDEQARAAELALTTARSLAAQPAVDEAARAQALAAVQAQETALAAVRTQQHALESAQWSAQTARNDLTMSQLSRLRNHFRELGDSSVNASGMVLQSFDAITGAVGENIAALAMQEATWAGAWDAMKYATVKSITEIASKEAVMQSAAGLAALASFNFSSAGLHFAAAAAYGTIALGAGYAAAATKPPKDEAAGGSPRTPVGLGPQGDTSTAQGAGSIVENYYGPVIDGRAATDDQVGMRVNRYQRDGARRLERPA